MEMHFHISIDDRLINFFKNFVSRKYLPRVMLFISLIPVALQASTVTIPNTFTAGTAINAAAMNANFTAIKTAVDDNYNKLSAVKQTSSGGGTPLPTTSSAVYNISVTAPSSGYILLLATGTIYLNTSVADAQLVRTKISTVSGDTTEDGYANFIRDSNMPQSTKMFPFSLSRIYPVTSGSSYTFYLNYWHQLGSASCISCATDDVQYTAIFIPKLL